MENCSVTPCRVNSSETLYWKFSKDKQTNQEWKCQSHPIGGTFPPRCLSCGNRYALYTETTRAGHWGGSWWRCHPSLAWVFNPRPRGEPAPPSCPLSQVYARVHVSLTYCAHIIGTFIKNQMVVVYPWIHSFYLPTYVFPFETVFLCRPNSNSQRSPPQPSRTD